MLHVPSYCVHLVIRLDIAVCFTYLAFDDLSIEISYLVLKCHSFLLIYLLLLLLLSRVHSDCGVSDAGIGCCQVFLRDSSLSR